MIQYTSFERVEDLRKWWKENGARIATGVALSLIAILGFILQHSSGKSLAGL